MKNPLKSIVSFGLLAFTFACGTQQPADAQNPPRSTAGFAPANLSGLATATFDDFDTAKAWLAQM